MSSREELLQNLLNTLSADNTLRANSEHYLNTLINKQPESLVNLLELTADDSIPFEIRLVAATFAKNKFKASWFIKDATNKYLKNEEIPEPVKNEIKNKIVEILLRISPFQHQSLFKQVLNCIQVILRLEPTWDSLLYQVSHKLLHDTPADAAKSYIGLSLIYQIAKKHCFDTDRSFIETIVQDQFPLYEQMLSSNFAQIKDPSTASIFYLILKIFKFCTFAQLPKYLTSDLSKLQNWCNYQLEIIKVEPTFTDADDCEDSNTNSHDHVLKKCQKWSFANLYRLKKRHAKVNNNGPVDPQVVEVLIKQFVPNILTSYLSFTGRQFTDICEYYLISFLTDCLSSNSVYEGYIKQNITPIITSIIVPQLSCTDAKIETFEDDPIEYVRRYIDSANLSIDFKSPEVAANEFVYALSKQRFQDVGETLFGIVRQIFQDKQSNLYPVEAGLKLLNNSWAQMAAVSQMDQAFEYFILPQLQDSEHKWLQTIACDTISEVGHKFFDANLARRVTEVVNQLIQNSGDLPCLQVEAISALNTLCDMPEVKEQTSQNIAKVVQLLLHLNNDYELELTSDIMDDFVLKFAKELEPFALDLAKTLNDQFLEGAQELLTTMANTNKDDYEKETQLSQLLTTLNTMVMSMNSQKGTTSSMLTTFANSVTFVLDNAMLEFTTEIMDLLETTNYVLKQITPEAWKLYDTVMDSFENYGYEYFSNYGPYLQTVINYGFRDVSMSSDAHLNRLLNALLNFYNSANDDEEMLEFTFDLTTLIVLNCSDTEGLIEPLLKPIFKSLQNLSIDIVRSYLRVFIAVFLKRPDLAYRVGEQNSTQISQFIEVWFDNSDELLTTVFDLKLQILALISILSSDIPGLDNMKEVMLRKLMTLVDRLPTAIDKRVKLLKMENEGRLEDFGLDEDEEFDIDDDEYAELNMDTPLDGVNVVAEFKQFIQKNQIQPSTVN